MTFKHVLLGAGALFATTFAGAQAQGLTEGQALAAMNNACSNVSTVSRDMKGNWHGTCSTGAMMVDTSGKVVADKNDPSLGLTQGQALAALENACSNVSEISQDSQGNWHGSCSNGAMMIDPKGNVVADKGGMAGGLTEANARSIANDKCSNVSDLAPDGLGDWIGTCSAGTIVIDKTGKLAVK